MSRPSFSTSLRGAAARLSEGLPVVLVAAFAALVLAAILVTIASRDSSGTGMRGFAELVFTPRGCSLDLRHQVNASRCARVSPSAYRVIFTRSLSGSTVVAGRGSCCAGQIGASIDTDKSVLISLPRKVTGPIRASVVIP